MAQSIYEAPATHCAVITPNDATDLAVTPRALITGSSGNLEIIAEDDTVAVTITGLAAGLVLPLRVKRVLTDTTISPLVAIW